MRNLFIAFAIVGLAGTPVAAQTAPAQPTDSSAKTKTVKKVVCKRVQAELGTGSRLGTQSKICREVEVAAPADKNGHSAHQNTVSGN